MPPMTTNSTPRAASRRKMFAASSATRSGAASGTSYQFVEVAVGDGERGEALCRGEGEALAQLAGVDSLRLLGDRELELKSARGQDARDRR